VGFPIIDGLAQFWASKAVRNPDGSYSIPHIMGPDEDHGDVTDSVYCNVVAQLTLRAAVTLAATLGVAPNATYTVIADGLVILFDHRRQCA
jgi:trehalose/maltose hydrolase-like predicted phosphorylase